MLSGTKDVQDAILADPKHAATVNVIDILQWQYRKDSSLYAPLGGQSLAPRQYERIISAGETSFGQIYRAVAELKSKYPEKAIVYSRSGNPLANWAAFMAGGSLVNLPDIKDKTFFELAVNMKPFTKSTADILSPQQYMLGLQGVGYIIFTEGNVNIQLPNDKTKYTIRWINPLTGEITFSKKTIMGGKTTTIEAPSTTTWVAWLEEKLSVVLWLI